MEQIKNKQVREGYEMISFDVISLFTNVPLDITIYMILKKVYDDKLINTSIKREVPSLTVQYIRTIYV